jgi:transposase-like protein
MDKKQRKEAILWEYLKGGMSLRELGLKHGINHRTIHRWVKEKRAGKVPETEAIERVGAGLAERRGEDLPTDIKQLRKELEEARLYNKLLNTMIDIAEDQMGIVIRKKPGAKR